MSELLQVLDLIDITAGDESRGHSLAACAARTADAVDVVLGIVGEVVVDHYLQVGDVDTAGRDICGDEELELRVLELVHDARALGLGDAAVEAVSRESLSKEGVGKFVDHALSVAEDDAEAEPVEIHQPDEGLGLAARWDFVEELLDIGSGDILALDRDGLGITRVAADELFDRAG